jgi:plasmid stabilization system protein ParE
MAITAKEYLSQARNIEADINAKLQEAERIRSQAEKITTSFSFGKTLGGEEGSRVENAAIKLVELEKAVLEDVDRLIQAKEEIRATIDQLQDQSQKTILRMRYLLGETWETIAYRSHYSWRNVHYIHKAALAEVAAILRQRGDDGLHTIAHKKVI